MKKALLLGLCLLTADLAIASNMGFKLTYNLLKTAGTTATNWVSLPYYWSGANAQDVCNDIGANATEVGKYNESTDTFTTWACGNVGTPFSLTAGSGIYIKVTTDGTPWVIVGSHNDTLSINLTKTTGTTATNWISVPYHTTATDAQGICSQIPNATEIGRYIETNDTFQTWACGNVGTPFTLNPGEGVYIKVTTNNTPWIPAHY